MATMSILSRLPLWAKALPVMAAVAGLAIVGSGITGDNAVRVNEPVTFLSGTNAVHGGDTNAAVIFNDDTTMIVSVDTYPGDSHTVKLELKNNSGVLQAQTLTIEAPAGFRFSAIGTADSGSADNAVTVAQEDNTHFNYTLDKNVSGGNQVLTFTVKVLPQVVPGFYQWSFTTDSLATETNFD